MNQNTPLPENLNTELEANVYRAIKAAQDSTPEALFTEIEKQVYNAIQAAGGTGGGGGGTAATIRVGTTTTLPPGSSATVTNSGTSSAAVFNFGIPAGERGEAGAAGPAGAQGAEGPAGTDGINGVDGKDGTAATITVGAVTTGAPETAAAVDNVGTSTAAIFNFTIPRGKDGADGKDGKDGADGTDAVAALVPRGDYSADATPAYVVNDYVSHDGNSYTCKVDNPTNAAPTTGQNDDPFWQLIALKGAKGDTGDTGPQGIQGEQGEAGPQGAPGQPGVTFTPSVSGAGELSWTNDGGLPNPASVNVMGPQGPQGAQGPEGPQGQPGPQGSVGPQGPEGPAGPEGPSGPAGADGAPGSQGPAGADGINGASGSLVDYAKATKLATTPVEHDTDPVSGLQAVAPFDGVVWCRYQCPVSAATAGAYWYVLVNGRALYLAPVNRSGGYVWSGAPVKKGDTIILWYPTTQGIDENSSYIRVAPFTDNSYSESEQVVGTWIDGKPIYRRVVMLTAPTTKNTQGTPVNISDVDTVINLSNTIKSFNSGDVIEVLSTAYNNIYVMYSRDTGSLAAWTGILSNGSTWAGASVIATIEYTKTTD